MDDCPLANILAPFWETFEPMIISPSASVIPHNPTNSSGRLGSSPLSSQAGMRNRDNEKNNIDIAIQKSVETKAPTGQTAEHSPQLEQSKVSPVTVPISDLLSLFHIA